MDDIGLQNQSFKSLYNPGDNGPAGEPRNDLGSVKMDGGGLFDGMKQMGPKPGPSGGPPPDGEQESPVKKYAGFMQKLRMSYTWDGKLGQMGQGKFVG